jgi:cell division septation protein DedD
MIRSRFARCARPIAAGLLLGMLAACGGGGNRVVTQATINGDWPRPASAAAPGPASDPWGPWIEQASRRFDVPERWIREVMRQESGGRQSATSRVGAMGLMQVMPGTYGELQRRYGLGTDPYHPWDNLMAGTAYLRQMYDLYGAPAFLAAYNAGPRRLEDYLWGSRGLPDETRNYVARIGPRIQGTSPDRRAPPEVYAAAELPFDIPRGPRRGDQATMLALREQRRAVDPGIQVAQLPPGPVVRMDPIPDGSTSVPPLASVAAITPPAPRTQIASAGPVVAMAPITSPGDFERRMEPVVSPGDPGTIRAETLAPPPGTRQLPAGAPIGVPAAAPVALAAAPSRSTAPAPRGFSLIPPAQAGTLPVPPRGTASAPAIATGGAWGVQVGAFASENLARAAAGQARDQIGALGTRVAVERVGSGSGALFRARVVGLASRNGAEQACDRLRGRGACMIVAPGA